MNQEELKSRMDNFETGWRAFGYHADYQYGIPCFNFRNWPRSEYFGIEEVYHAGASCRDKAFPCFIVFTDGRIQEMPPHPPGECGWCDYLRFDVEE